MGVGHRRRDGGVYWGGYAGMYWWMSVEFVLWLSRQYAVFQIVNSGWCAERSPGNRGFQAAYKFCVVD